MKRLLSALCIAAALAASSVFAQTSVVQSVNNVSNRAQTYHASANVTLASTPHVFATLVGSATKTVYVKNLEVSCVKTAGGYSNVALLKVTTANSGGTATQPTIVPADSSNATATAVFNVYTVDPTVGTNVSMAQAYVAFPAPATLADSRSLTKFFGTGMDQNGVLRGVAQSYALNGNGATLTGAVCSINVTWLEQ